MLLVVNRWEMPLDIIGNSIIEPVQRQEGNFGGWSVRYSPKVML